MQCATVTHSKIKNMNMNYELEEYGRKQLQTVSGYYPTII